MKTVFDIMEGNDSRRKAADFVVKQQLPYEFKVNYAKIRAKEFVQMCDEHDKNYHVSVGGLDSITLLIFLRSIGIKCPAMIMVGVLFLIISVSVGAKWFAQNLYNCLLIYENKLKQIAAALSRSARLAENKCQTKLKANAELPLIRAGKGRKEDEGK